jgi:hypothetical protein
MRARAAGSVAVAAAAAAAKLRLERVDTEGWPYDVDDLGCMVVVVCVVVLVAFEESERVELDAACEWYDWVSFPMLGRLLAFESVRESPFFHMARLLGVLGVVGVSTGEGGRLWVAS